MKKFCFLIMIGLLFLISCKKDSPVSCDPCAGKALPSAHFLMEDGIFAHDVYYADSVFKARSHVQFRSELDHDAYQHIWYVGAETITDVNVTSRDFRFEHRPQDITIHHVIRYTPDIACFPQDDGYDSTAQTFRLIKNYKELQAYGKFRGVIEGKTDSFTIEFIPLDFDYNQYPDFGRFYQNMVINFHNEGDTLYSGRAGSKVIKINVFNHDYWFEDSSNRFIGDGKVDADGRIKLQYVDDYATDDTKVYVFTGKRI